MESFCLSHNHIDLKDLYSSPSMGWYIATQAKIKVVQWHFQEGRCDWLIIQCPLKLIYMGMNNEG